jgi:sec-independent protein translocase protein TatC
MSSEEKVLPFLDHLVELRKRLIIVFVAVVIGMGLSWNISTNVLDFVQRPLTGKTYLTEVKKTIYGAIRQRYPDLYERYKLEQEINTPAKDRKLNYSAPLEPFFIQCKISMLTGFLLALPIVFHQLWLFVAPGLTRKEKKMAVPFVTASTVSFCIGAMFFLIVIWPVIINFSISYESEGLQSWFNLSAYINFCLRLILIFGLIFELPILTLLLARFGIVNGPMLGARRKYAILASAIIAAFHADLITMFVIMVPLYLMYEISIWVAYLFAKKKKEPAPDDSDEIEPVEA